MFARNTTSVTGALWAFDLYASSLAKVITAYLSCMYSLCSLLIYPTPNPFPIQTIKYLVLKAGQLIINKVMFAPLTNRSGKNNDSKAVLFIQILTELQPEEMYIGDFLNTTTTVSTDESVALTSLKVTFLLP